VAFTPPWRASRSTAWWGGWRSTASLAGGAVLIGASFFLARDQRAARVTASFHTAPLLLLLLVAPTGLALPARGSCPVDVAARRTRSP
jgi:hypothetical protein